MNESEKGFVISLSEYREHDAMIHFLGEGHGLMRLVLPGYYRSKSKQHALGLQWSYVEYQFRYKENSLNRIISGELLEANLMYRQDFEWLSFMTFVSELLVRTYDFGYHKNIFERFKNIVQNKVDVLVVIGLIKLLIDIHGFTPNTDACVVCRSKKIDSFSVEHGGFLCQEHSTRKNDKLTLVLIYQVFHELELSSCDEKTQYDILNILVSYFEFHGDYRFNSWQFIYNNGR